LAGQLLTIGFTLSVTIIWKEQTSLPQLFVAVTETKLVPTFKVVLLPVPEPLAVVAPVMVYV
jgi:hypothetical protein